MDKSQKKPKPSFDLFQTITDLICDQIAQGVAPWNKPRLTVNLGTGSHSRAINMVSKKPYEGINALILGCSPYNVPIFSDLQPGQGIRGHGSQGSPVFARRFLAEIEDGKGFR